MACSGNCGSCGGCAKELTLTPQQTYRTIQENREELRRLQLLEGQLSGRMEGLGDRFSLQTALDKELQRIEKLEEIYGAVCLAMDTLTEAAVQLQRKFAPRISGRAQQLFAEMNSRGWYPGAKAEEQKLNQTKMKYSVPVSQ